jgi:hypothetical protein
MSPAHGLVDHGGEDVLSVHRGPEQRRVATVGHRS